MTAGRPIKANGGINNNWRVDQKTAIRGTQPQTPVNRNWLKELIAAHDNPTTPSDLRDKALVVAPMVDQSDLPFRLQCKRYGANLCYTPMIHARLFQENEFYRARFIVDQLPSLDRPVIAQLCGPSPHVLLKTAKEIAPFVDGIDLNCGCPQGIAKKGLYGAFLLEEEELLLAVVQTLVENLDIPICVKVRLLPTGVEDSLKLYTKLADCGISLLTIHGRDRHQKNYMTGESNWKAIRQAVDFLGDRIPILANGGISSLQDVRECLKVTAADGVMSSEAILEYPCIFMDETLQQGINSGPGRLALAKEYMELAKQYPPNKGGQGSGLKCIRMHMHKYLHADLQVNTDLRMQCVDANSVEDLESVLVALTTMRAKEEHDISKEHLTWYMRHRETGGLSWEERLKRDAGIKHTELSDDAAECFTGLFGGDDADY